MLDLFWDLSLDLDLVLVLSSLLDLSVDLELSVSSLVDLSLDLDFFSLVDFPVDLVLVFLSLDPEFLSLVDLSLDLDLFSLVDLSLDLDLVFISLLDSSWSVVLLFFFISVILASSSRLELLVLFVVSSSYFLADATRLQEEESILINNHWIGMMDLSSVVLTWDSCILQRRRLWYSHCWSSEYWRNNNPPVSEHQECFSSPQTPEKQNWCYSSVLHNRVLLILLIHIRRRTCLYADVLCFIVSVNLCVTDFTSWFSLTQNI